MSDINIDGLETTSITQSSIEVAAGIDNVNVDYSNSALVDVDPHEYHLTSTGIYTGRLEGGIPLWLTEAITTELTSGDGNFQSIINDLAALVLTLQSGVNQNITHIETANLSLAALETSVVSRLDENAAGILSLDVTKVTATEAIAISTDVLSTTFGGNVNAYIANIASTYVDANSAIAQEVDVLAAGINDQAVSITALDEVSIFKSATIRSNDEPTLITHPLLKAGDLWINTANNVVKSWNGAAWVDTTNAVADAAQAAANNALTKLTDLEEVRDGEVVIFYETSTTIPVGMSYGDYMVDTDSWTGTVYVVYRWEALDGSSTGTLAWRANTGEVARTLSAAYRADVLAILAQVSADTANINNSAQYYNINPSFEDWDSTYPDGYTAWSAVPTKENVLTKNGNNAVRCVVLANTNGGLNFNDPVLLPDMPDDEYLSVSVTVRLESGTFAGSGLRVDYMGTLSDGVTTQNYNSPIHFNLEIPTPEIGRWYTITKVLKRPTTVAGWIFTRMDGYLFGHYSAMNGGYGSAIDIIFDNLYIRKATNEEVYTLEALQELADIASDNVLSPNEKPSVIKEYNVIITEQTGIDAQASSYGITTEKTAYDTAVSALITYLATLTSPVLWSDITGNTTIVGSTFRGKFETVYTTKQTLLNKISAVAKALADTAQSTADGKVKAYYTTLALRPTLTAADVGDLWISTDVDTVGLTKVWSGTGWVDTTNTTSDQAYIWSAKSAKYITALDGSITGWQITDGTGQASAMTIAADSFKIVNSSTWNPTTKEFDISASLPAPFSVDTVNSKVQFNGVVDFTNTNIANNYPGTTTINGGLVTTGKIQSANTNTYFDLANNQIKMNNGTGFIFNSSVVGTSTTPNIQGGFIKAGTVQSNSFLSGASGWILRSDGSAEFNGVVLSRDLVVMSNTHIGTTNYSHAGSLIYSYAEYVNMDPITLWFPTGIVGTGASETTSSYTADASVTPHYINYDNPSLPTGFSWMTTQATATVARVNDATVITTTTFGLSYELYIKVVVSFTDVYRRFNYANFTTRWSLKKVT